MPVSGQQLAQLLATPHASPTSPPSLSPEQTRHIHQLVEYFSPPSASSSVGSGGASTGKSPTLPLSTDEQLFLSRETLLRFLTATKNDVPATLARLDKCLLWRRSLSLGSNESIKALAADVAPEGVCGKEFVLGYSKKGQPVLHFLPNKSDTKESDRQLRHVVYMLERTADLMPPGVTNLLLIIDFAGKKSAPTSPTMARSFITILQDFYPERLGCAVLLSIPWIVRKFLDIAFTFVDPVTKGKVRWHVDVVKEGLVAGDQALKEYGGNIDFVYKQEDYWPLLLSTSLAKRSQYLANWEHLGGGVGVSEWDFKRPLPAATMTATATSAVQEQLPQTQTAVNPQKANQTPPTTTTTTTNTPSSSSISSEATLFHETHHQQQQQQQHGLDMHALEKGMSGGMVIAEHDGAVDPIPTSQRSEREREQEFAAVVGV